MTFCVFLSYFFLLKYNLQSGRGGKMALGEGGLAAANERAQALDASTATAGGGRRMDDGRRGSDERASRAWRHGNGRRKTGINCSNVVGIG